MPKRVTVQYSLGTEREFVKNLCEQEHTFKIERTNYSLKVKTERRNYVFRNPDGGTNRSFLANKMIQRDIRERGLATPDVTARDVQYFWFSAGNNYPSEFYSIDINSAYPTVLKKVGAISDDTYEYLTTKISKVDRLRCVGMLATNKTVYDYVDGNLKTVGSDVSPLSGWFFLCCLLTGEIMQEVLRRYPEQSLYFWVDGIAVRSDEADILNFVESLGYPCKLEHITECVKSDYSLKFLKDGKQKCLALPQQVAITNEEILQFMGYGGLG